MGQLIAKAHTGFKSQIFSSEKASERERERAGGWGWGLGRLELRKAEAVCGGLRSSGKGALVSSGAGTLRTLRTPTKAPLGVPRGCQQGSQGHHKKVSCDAGAGRALAQGPSLCP